MNYISPFYNPKATNVTECPEMMARAAREARRRRLAPHCFDANGNLIPGMIADVWEAERKAAEEDARAMQDRWKAGPIDTKGEATLTASPSHTKRS